MLFLIQKQYQPHVVVAAAFLIHASLGASYGVVNLVPYIASYLRYIGHETRSVGQMAWFDALNTGAQGLSMFLGGLLEKRLGTRSTVLLGSILVLVGAGSTFFSIHFGAGAAYVTYGLIYGVGKGISYAPCIACAMRWFPKIRGLIAGITVSGFGVGFLLSTLASTLFVNPTSRSPRITIDSIDGSEIYDDMEMLQKVPYAFIIIAGVCGLLQVIALPLIRNPKSSSSTVEDLPDIITTTATLELHRVTKPSKVENIGMLPLDVTRTQTFYNLWLTFFLNASAINFMITYYREFGYEIRSGNQFLDVTTAVAAAFSAFGPVLWGRLTDRYSYQVTMSVISASMAALLFTLDACREAGKPMFLIWVIAMYTVFSGTFAVFPAVTVKVFGPANFTAIYGILFTACSAACVLTAVVSTAWLQSWLFTGFFFIFAFAECGAFVLAATINFTDYGKPQGLSVYGVI